METCPLDILTKLVEFLHNQQFKTVDVDLIVRLTLSTAASLKFYLNSCAPYTQPTVPSGVGNPRYCFRLCKSAELTGNNEFRSYHDRVDVFMITLVKLIEKFVSATFFVNETTGELLLFSDESSTDDSKLRTKNQKSLGELMLQRRRDVVNRFLSCLSISFCDLVDFSLDIMAKKLIDMDVSNVITITDGVLLILIDLYAKGANSKLIVECCVDYLRSATSNARRSTLSEPLIAYFCYVLNGSIDTVRHFVDINGLDVFAKKFLDAGLPFDSELFSEETQLLRKAASLCANVQKSSAAADSASAYNTPKKLSQMQIEGMTNFAPLCKKAFLK